jgi:hypothetical protein
LAGGLNLYGFAGGDPINFSDPFGLCPEKPWECPEIQAESAAVEAKDKGLESPLIDPVAVGTGFFTGIVRSLFAKVGVGLAGSASTVLKGAVPDAVPVNLPQQMALNAARAGTGERIMGQLADAPRLATIYGAGEWAKMQLVVRGTQGNITVHWFRNLTTQVNVEFKFAHIAAAYMR